MIFTVIKRKDFKKVAEIVKSLHPNAFYTTEEVKSIHLPPFPLKSSRRRINWNRLLPKRRRFSRTTP
jgi:hypothetical protein